MTRSFRGFVASAFGGLLIKPARISLVPRIDPGRNLIGCWVGMLWMVWKLGEAGDASLASASSPWVEGRFQARFHWALEYDAGDVLSFSSWAVFFWASSMTEIQGGNSLLLLRLSIDTSNITRNNGYKIVGKRFQTNEAKHFFFNRVVNVWNGLPSNVIDCSTTDIFKKRLDVYLAANPRLELFAPV